MVSNVPSSPLTVRRRLRERIIRSHWTAMKVAYATIWQDFGWRNVIFSDKAVVSGGNYGPPRVYRIDDHWYDERFVTRLRRSGCVSVACWGWISYDWAGTLERIHGRFTVDTYEQILTNVMIPSAWELYPWYTPPIGFKNGFVEGLTYSNGLQIHLIWIQLKMCGLEWKGSYALIGQNHPFEHQPNYGTEY